MARLEAEGKQLEDLMGQRSTPEADSAGVERLREENQRLRLVIAELQRRLADAAAQAEQALAERQKDYEAMLEEKSEVIRQLHQRIQELQDRPHSGIPGEEEVLALSEELERERRQLEEDEQSLMKQMCEMEMQMSRERAELARQRNELQRLHSEIQHELETASRDSALRERLLPLQRRQQQMIPGRAGSPGPEAAAPSAPPAASDSSSKVTRSGMFRRLFGKSES
jgi:chromosome segregation ATPase